MVISYLSILKSGMSRNEMVFLAMSWIPKATVQGALSSSLLDSLVDALNPAHPRYAEFLGYGRAALTVAVLSIFITAPIGLLVINLLGPKMLKQVRSWPLCL